MTENNLYSHTYILTGGVLVEPICLCYSHTLLPLHNFIGNSA